MAKLIVCMQRVQLDQWHLDTFFGGVGGLLRATAGIALGGLRRTVGAEYHQHRNQAEQHRSTEASVSRNGRLAAAGLEGLGVQRSVVTAVAHPQVLLLGDPAEEVPQLRVAIMQHVAKAALLCALFAMRAVGCAQRNHVAA
ncbi:hypothetical protein [Xanthomonas oryzae]|uniref:hypothetical protein n=1 Tax=Xanthomonas oryzae TaxID=347 RepID=UPI000CA1812A|nr:hypothetical protein [Xanthomonas oryzae]AUI89635.1 hypothetical protein BVV16_04390 [Xanthomonas oryzae pv. oryzae]AUI93312.1 hypothetical protein BVV17_04390 [Xanthomonas oryzae pv. oryzae]AUJ00655.1 hypothetical protein BVV10_04395 [Xanthomonas oryzae pv. oryzae]AUJ04333.1 hypothetical protein BVV19_04400 [Xanthomonas oryzae pv. oryzae]AUJ08002.1 hypothetical protein BVV09_04390 [Xanthomonas oryzae pv. oryzae]